MTKTDAIQLQLKRSFNGPAWHGPSVLEVIEKLRPEQASASHSGSHTIIEILGHMTAWRSFVIEKLKGNADYDVTEAENFPKASDLTMTIAALKASQQILMDCIQQFPEERLKEKVPGRDYSYHTMLNGIVHHDLYHLGQVALLSR